MENKKVMVRSECNGRLGIDNPELSFKRVWEKRGAVKPIELEVLEQLMYNEGVEYMFKEGMLVIDDMEVKKVLGLEPEDAEEPQNIIVLTDKERERYLNTLPVVEFKTKIKELSHEQLNVMVEYAIEKELTNIDKSEILKELTGIDIIKAVQLNRQAKEA